ncbi:RNA polymerase sigma-70 factor [Dyadobacter sp. 676]|uniref:RNA polymerase sigma-70 factor n=1 Tax=Dyadobacter sp. 676 TaxID=3088362 RepID=A0AAU8FKI7_9BACT
MAKISSGDPHAFAALFHDYQGLVYSFAKRLTRSETLAEDIVQEIFLKIWLGRAALGSVDNFGAYLNRTVRNHSLNVLRQIARQARASQELGLVTPQEIRETEAYLDLKESETILAQALKSLTPQQRQVFLLCREDGLKYEEVAARLQISPLTVHSHMKQALKTIRSYFKDNLGVYPILLFYLFR